MTTRFPRPYLGGEVEMTAEREHHITENHPDLLPEHLGNLALTLADPDHVTGSARFGNARLFGRWHAEVRGGKHLVVVVISETTPALRHWIVTAYLACKLAEGDREWVRSKPSSTTETETSCTSIQ